MTENILDIAARHARQAQAARVTDIHIVIGQLSSIMDDSVQFYWDIISEGTLCAGAKLHFERRPARLSCSKCGNSYILQGELMACPSCDSARVVIISGDEFLLESIDIEKELKE